MSEGKRITLRCERIQADVPNLNGRTYTRKTFQQMVARVNEKGAQRRMLGKLGQDATPVTMCNASHLVLSGKLDEDGQISAEIEVLETEPGRTLADWLASGKDVEIVPCGVGTVGEDGVIGADYKLTRFDVVPKLTEREIEEAPRARGEEKE